MCGMCGLWLTYVVIETAQVVMSTGRDARFG